MKILFLKLFLISTFIDPNFVKYFTNLAENPLKTLTLRSSWSSFFPSLSASVKRFSVFRVQDFIISYIISRKYRISKPTALQIVYLKRIDNFFLDNLTILEVLNLLNIGISSLNIRREVPNYLPSLGRYVDNKELKFKIYLNEIKR